MQRIRTICTLALLAPALGALLVAGCGKGGDQAGGPSTEPSGGGPAPAPAKAVVVKETATIKGRVTYAGDPPKLPDLSERDDFKTNNDKDHCAKGPVTDPTWVVNPKNKGVQNVVVFVKAPGRDYFVVPEANRTNKKTVEVDQPFCAFVPHVTVLYPAYRDEKGATKSTGQKFVVKNSAPMNHNTHLFPSGKANSETNLLIKSKEEKELDLKPDSREIQIKCDLHRWMTGYIWAFDHPYAAVTDEDGNFEIKDVPAGSEIYVVAWHEAGGYKPNNQGEKMTLKPGDVKSYDITIK
jgi:hypothetical protein